jgi:hypothetical protein
MFILISNFGSRSLMRLAVQRIRFPVVLEFDCPLAHLAWLKSFSLHVIHGSRGRRCGLWSCKHTALLCEICYWHTRPSIGYRPRPCANVRTLCRYFFANLSLRLVFFISSLTCKIVNVWSRVSGTTSGSISPADLVAIPSNKEVSHILDMMNQRQRNWQVAMSKLSTASVSSKLPPLQSGNLDKSLGGWTADCSGFLPILGPVTEIWQQSATCGPSQDQLAAVLRGYVDIILLPFLSQYRITILVRLHLTICR